MESALSPDKEKHIPPVPIKTYQWEDLRRAREIGGYPWTHFLKPPIEGEITADDIIRETTPRRSMSREVSRSRTHTPVDSDTQRILILDNSPGSCRKHSEEGEDEGVHVPNFSKEVSLDSEEETIKQDVNIQVAKRPESQTSSHFLMPIEIPKNVSPKGILKRRVPEQQYIGISESREKTKCCHPLVNKIKHLADKTLHKLERSDIEKSPQLKRKKNEETQEIRQLRSSPGAVRRQKFSVIKLGDSDEMSKTMIVETPPLRKKKEHIYEDIEEAKAAKCIDNQTNEEEKQSNSNKENESFSEKKSIASQDPSLVAEEIPLLKPEDHIMEKLHKKDEVKKEAVLLDDELDIDELNVEEIFQNQLEESKRRESPNITITEIIDDEIEPNTEQSSAIPFETSPSPSPRVIEGKRNVEFMDKGWSRPSSDHEYEIIEKPQQNIIYTKTSVDDKPALVKTDDELSSTTSLERKYLQHTSDEDEHMEEKGNVTDDNTEGILSAQALQNDIEDRFFVNTPSTVSRTECEISTSQVDSSALENLPLKRENRSKNFEKGDSKIQQKIKEGTGKLKTQAEKLKTKLQNIKTKQFTSEKPKNNLPEKSKFKMPERPKISLPERPKFTLPDRRKFSLPEKSKFRNMNFTQKLSLGDRKKFTFPDRPKFSVPELPKLKMPDKPKINFPSLGRKKQYKVEKNATGSNDELQNVATVEFESKTYPRLFSRKKKSELPKTSSSPTLNREDTPPPIFTFTRVKKVSENPTPYIPDSPEQPREYGNVDNEEISVNGIEDRKQFDIRYDFDKLQPEYMDDETEEPNLNNAASISDVSPTKQKYTHVINEIDNDEFFVRPRGISRENIQVREYLSDEIRQAFKIPKNALALMSSDPAIQDVSKDMYVNNVGIDPELMVDENEQIRYSNENFNDKDDGYYTFPPVRPSRAKRKKKELESVQYIDDNVSASRQFSEVDLGLPEDHEVEVEQYTDDFSDLNGIALENHLDFATTDLHSIHEYANDDVIEYPDATPVQSQTLPMPPKRKKKFEKNEYKHSSLSDFKDIQGEMWENHQHQPEDVIVYRTEHEYIIPQTENTVTEQSPLPPRRNRSRSSRGTSFCDDDRTSHGAESLTLDTNIALIDESEREIRHESPGYATVDKGPYVPNKTARRSYSKTPPARRRKSNSSERKYYTVGSTKNSMPNRPPRKKSSTSLLTLDSFTKRSVSGDLTQYVEIDEPQLDEVQKDLKSGEVLSKMKDRPLPPPPRPPRGSKRRKKNNKNSIEQINIENGYSQEKAFDCLQNQMKEGNVIEIEVSTQTDPLPDDVDFELEMDDNLNMSMNSLRDLVDEDSSISKSLGKLTDNIRTSRPTSRSEKSIKLSDPKISELSKSNLGRTSPTVILVERRVSSPTRINEREEMLTEASLTVQHIDVDESQIPDVPPLPRARVTSKAIVSPKSAVPAKDERNLEKVDEANRDVQLENLVTQRLQVRDLDVGRLNVSELQASKILVSDIEGMTLQVTELDSKSGHLSVSGIEFSQSVIDEIVKKFAEISTNNIASQSDSIEHPRPFSREEQTQTDKLIEEKETPEKTQAIANSIEELTLPPADSTTPPHGATNTDDNSIPPQRPPPPDLAPLFYSYLQDFSVPSGTFYSGRLQRDRPFSELSEIQHQTPAPPTRRAKRKPAAPISESSSEDSRLRPSPRRMVPPVRVHEPSITEAGVQFFRVCHNSISRIFRNIFNSFMSYISGTEDKKDVQMALVIFLVLIAGLIMFGLSDSRTIHHHHWEFFNPPDGKQ